MVGAGSLLRPTARVIAVVLVLLGLVAPVGAQGASLMLGVDVARFSERAAAWSSASSVRQAENLERAAELARTAAQAAAEAEAAAAAARAATTTVPPTTVAPTTTAAPEPAEPPAGAPPAPEPTGGGPTAEQWAALRHCESGGRYDAVSPSGRYRGAYQFSQATWDWVASFANPALVGVDPAASAPADQDAQAQALYDRQQASPWPHCGTHLP